MFYTYYYEEKKTKKPIYVGLAVNDFRKRLADHKREERFFPYLHRCNIYYHQWKSEADMRIMEKVLIKAYNPVLNIVDLPMEDLKISVDIKWIPYYPSDEYSIYINTHFPKRHLTEKELIDKGGWENLSDLSDFGNKEHDSLWTKKEDEIRKIITKDLRGMNQISLYVLKKINSGDSIEISFKNSCLDIDIIEYSVCKFLSHLSYRKEHSDLFAFHTSFWIDYEKEVFTVDICPYTKLQRQAYEMLKGIGQDMNEEDWLSFQNSDSYIEMHSFENIYRSCLEDMPCLIEENEFDSLSSDNIIKALGESPDSF